MDHGVDLFMQRMYLKPTTLAESRDCSELGSSAAAPIPFHSETGTGNGNEYDVMTKIGRGVRGYIGSQTHGA